MLVVLRLNCFITHFLLQFLFIIKKMRRMPKKKCVLLILIISSFFIIFVCQIKLGIIIKKKYIDTKKEKRV
jgi:cytosine/uracil/thiamine/allantoin permease